MLFKNKGSVNDPTKYRCIGLLPHAYKILSLVLLERIHKECNEYLSDWQAGFRPERSCRDNILLLCVLFDQALAQGEELVVTFIDYSAAFDSSVAEPQIPGLQLKGGRRFETNQVNLSCHLYRSKRHRSS